MPTIFEILEAALSNASRKSYATYQKQYSDFLIRKEINLDLQDYDQLVANILEFFHYLSEEKTLKAGTNVSAKSTLVNLFQDLDKNPAQDKKMRRYANGLDKFRKSNNLEEETHAHPINAFELSEVMVFLNLQHPLFATITSYSLQLRFLLVFV